MGKIAILLKDNVMRTDNNGREIDFAGGVVIIYGRWSGDRPMIERYRGEPHLKGLLAKLKQHRDAQPLEGLADEFDLPWAFAAPLGVTDWRSRRRYAL